MCVSSAPAHFSNTILLAAEVAIEEEQFHLLGYQNTMQNLAAELTPAAADWGWSGDADASKPATVGNAMLLPIPAVQGTLGEHSVIDASLCPRILKDMAAAVRPPQTRFRATLGADSFAKNAPVVFDTGIYTVVLAEDASDIPAALSRVPERKRPALNQALFDAYASFYPGWYVALCCFDNAEAKQADPLLWYYKPQRPEFLFAPALDSHTGGVPDLNAQVKLDHTLVVSSYFMEGGHEVHYTDGEISPKLRQTLPKRVFGSQFHTTARNGDFVVRVQDLAAGKFDPKRLPPPGVRRATLGG